MSLSIPSDRAAVAVLSAAELAALDVALDAARLLVEDVRDERVPQTHCNRFDHPGHQWTRFGRSRYCPGDGPFMDRKARGRCGADWPHPGHAMGEFAAPCPGVPADPAAVRYRHVCQWLPSDPKTTRQVIRILVAEDADFHHPSGVGATTTLLIHTSQGDLLVEPGEWLVRADGGPWQVIDTNPVADQQHGS